MNEASATDSNESHSSGGYTSKGKSENGASQSHSSMNGSPEDKQEAEKAGASGAPESASVSDDDEELYNGMPKKKYMSFKPQSPEKAKTAPMEVSVDHGVERAIKILKRKLIKEGLFKELKSRRYYTKPSEEKKRRLKESMKKLRKEESRRQKSQLIF